MSDARIPKFSVGDKIETKKSHPCGSSTFEIVRLGSDVRLICSGCGRDLTLNRIKVEKFTKKVIPQKSDE